MALPTVIVTEALDETCADWLSRHARVVRCPHENPDELRRHLSQADGLVVRTYTRVDDGLLSQAPRLRVVGRAGVGLDNVDLPACQKRGVQVVYTPDANTQAVVEYTLGLMFDALRPRPTMTAYVTPETFHELRRKHTGTQLDSLTLGILGFGRIGKRLGKVAHALGMNILANDLLPAPQLQQDIDYPCRFVDKPTLYRGSDVLSIHIDSRTENQQMVNAQMLSQLKPNCLLINASRGAVIDNPALTQWARNVAGTGGQAVLDVHEPEPPPRDYPLFGLPNVRLLPHLASRTPQALLNMSWVVRDVVAVLEGRQPAHPAF